MNRRFYNFGGFRLDTHNQRFLRGGEAITLTIKQFERLLALVRNAGDVVSGDRLFEQVWKDVAVADETLTRNISWLRQRLGDGALIETVPKSEIAETDKFNGSGFAGMTAAPDGKTIVFAQFDQNASHIMLAEIKK